MKHPALILLFCASLPAAAQILTTPTTNNGGQGSIQANPANGNNKPIDIAHSIYISGKVVMQDGTPVPQSVTIQRVCSGSAKTVAYTDERGRFNFRWNDSASVLADAADAGSGSGKATGGYGSSQSAGGGNPMSADPFGNRMMNCDLRAVVAGFTSTTYNLFNQSIAENPDIGALVLSRIAGVEGSSVSVTSMLAPKNAKKAYDHGLQSVLKDKPSDAVKDFEKAVSLYPNYAEAWLNLGKLRLQGKAIETARTAFLKAIGADPKLVPPYLELGLLYAGDTNWVESGKYLDQAVKLDPVDFPQAWYADAVAHYNLKNYGVAEKSAREAVKLDPKHANPRADYLLGLILAEKQDYAGAVVELNEYIQLAPGAPDLAQVKNQLAEIEKLQGAGKQALRQ